MKTSVISEQKLISNSQNRNLLVVFTCFKEHLTDVYTENVCLQKLTGWQHSVKSVHIYQETVSGTFMFVLYF